MNLKNFPKSLDSKTSCLRITIPENLDLALEGLIRKVLRDQPKIDEIHAFAADYFDTLLKIREKIGTKFAADQLCLFHNDEDAHEMIKLASVFVKPEILKTKIPKIEKTKNLDNKGGRKKPSRSTVESKKPIFNVRQTVEIQKKPERLPGEKKARKLHETKPEEQNQLKLEPKTEDVGDDEEFLKSDSIKLLVEKELMDATKPQLEDKNKEEKNEASIQLSDQLQEPTEKEELCSVMDKDHIKTEEKRTVEIVNKEEEKKTEDAQKNKDKNEDVKTEEENKAVEKTEKKIHNTKEDSVMKEKITEALNSANSIVAEEIKKKLRGDAKTNYEEAEAEILDEIKSENNLAKFRESLAAEEEEGQAPVANETKEEAKSKGITHAGTNQETLKEIAEEQDVPKGKFLEGTTELDSGKNERAVREETQDAVKNKVTKESTPAEEANLNPEEMCTVVDILSMKSHEKNELNAEQIKEGSAVEPKFIKEEETNEVKIKTEKMLTNEDKEGAQTQKLVNALENAIESTIAKKAEEANVAISPNEKEAQEESEKFIPEIVKTIEESSDAANSVEKLKVQINSEDDKSDVKTMQEEEVKKTVSEGSKPVSFEDQKPTPDNLQVMRDNDTAQTSKTIKDKLAPEENTIKETSKTKIENGNGKGEEEQLRFEENRLKVSENEERLIMPEKAEMTKGSETQPENEDIICEESSEVKEEAIQRVKTEIEAEKLIHNYEKTEEVNSVTNNQEPFEDPPIIKEEQANLTELTGQSEVEGELQKEELKPEEEMEGLKEVEEKVMEEETIYEKPKEGNDVTGFSEKTDFVETAEHAAVTLPKDSEKDKLLFKQEEIKTKNLSEDLNMTMPGDDLSTVTDSQHVIKIEEADKLPEENSYTEGVQIKTIQTHYYDTLQVPAQLNKEYRVHPVKSDNVADNLLNITNVVLSSDKGQETSAPPLNIPQQDDDELSKRNLEDSLMTPSSGSSLNVSELSIQTISEMFLNSEKQYSGRERERRYLNEKGDECEDESHAEKREVEEIIQKTITPPPVKATPVAPRDDAEINEEANVEGSLKDEKKQEPSVDSDERMDNSNGGRSGDNDTPVTSVEVKTVIETLNLEDEGQGKDGGGDESGGGSDVQLRIEATIDIPEEVIVDVREEKEYKDEVRQHASNEPQTSEAVPKDSETSPGARESTMSSTASEMKRNDSAKRHFGSPRTLITTRSLDLDKRHPLLKTRSLSSFRQGVIDFEVWNVIEKELEEAATKIQSNFRGYKTRKKLQRENAVHITTEESSCSTTPVEQESREERQQSTGEFHDSIVLPEHPR